jgi:uncharacterized protein
MRRFAEYVLTYRLAVIVITLILTLFFGIGLTKISINSDMLSYLKPDDPVVKLFNRIGDDYGGNTIEMVALETDDIFSFETLSLVAELTDAYAQVPGVSTVLSLTNILDIAKTDAGMETRKLIDKYEIPSTAAELRALRDYTLGKEMYAGKFVSEAGDITLILCRLHPDSDKEDVARAITQLTDAKVGGARVYYSGLPSQMLESNSIIINDIKFLIPIVVLVVVCTLYFSFRSLRGVLLPLLNVALATLWAVGLMGWLGVEMSIISNIMPVILIAIGSAYGIHFLSKANEDMHAGAERRTVLTDALSEVGVPILLTGLTTLIGFLSFIGSYLTAITDFGLFTAFGVGVAMLLAITLIPATLSYLPLPVASSGAARQEKHLLVHVMDRLGEFVLKRATLILAAAVVIVLLAITGIPRITTESNMIEFFPEDSTIRVADTVMREKFGGSTPVQMLMTGDLKDPFVLKEMLRMQQFMESLPDVNNAQSLADLICEMNYVMNGHYTIPETRDRVANLLFMLEGEEMLDQMVNRDYSEGVIQARFASSNSDTITFVVNALNDYIANELDAAMQVVALADLDAATRRTLVAFQVPRISAAIGYDARNRLPSGAYDAAAIEARVREIATIDVIPLSDTHQEQLSARLTDFFWDEADVILNADDDIAVVVDAILEAVAAQPISEEALAEVLRENIAPAYWEDDPEVIDLTVEFLAPILTEQQHFNRIDAAVAALLPLFPDVLQQHSPFHDDLRDNLWVLNEGIVAVPTALNLAQGGEISTIASQQSGMVIVMDRINQSLIGSQLRSLFWALGLVAGLMSIQFRSLKMGLIVTSPIVLTILTSFAVMGYTGVPLDLATAMIASVAIGIGIDYSIHFSSRFRAELQKQPDELFALDKALETTGRAILINALTVALGFIVLLGANIVPIQRFGWMVALTMVVSATSALTFLPAVILTFKRFLFEQRQAPRLQVPLSARRGETALERYTLVNLSQGGLCVRSPQPLTIGERFDLDVLLADNNSLRCPVRVIWQRQLTDEAEAEAMYEVGLRFGALTDEITGRLADVLRRYAE